MVVQGTLGSGFIFSNTAASTADLTVLHNTTTGDLSVLAGSAEVDDGDGTFPWGDSQGNRLGAVLISRSGIAAAGFSLDLPPGLGWRDGVKGILSAVFNSGGIAMPLTENLTLSASVSGVFPAGREFISETLAVAFTPPSFSFDGTSLTLTQPGSRFLQRGRYFRHFSIKGALPKANDSYLYYLLSPAGSDLVVSPGATGGISISLNIDSGFFPTHFPDAEIDGTGATIQYVNNTIDPASSFAANWIRLQYEQGCPDLATSQKQGMRIVNPIISWTPQGGLTATGALATPAQVPGTERHLVAGLNEDVEPVHQTDQFTDAEFYLPGFCAPGEGPGIEPNPARFVLAETRPANGFALGYPGSPAYTAGQGLYAGFNFFHFAGLQTASRVGGESPVSYPLLPNAKFYNRCSGVSGIAEADPAALSFNIAAYGFQISFTDWGFNFLSNEMLESYIDGQVDPTPNNNEGYLTFSGDLDVAFFENMRVRGFTRANPNDPEDKLFYFFHGDHLADGGTDADHFGVNGIMSPADYRLDDSRLPHARGSFFGKQDTFDFPVSFNPPTGNFYSAEDKGADLLIVETESGVDRLNSKLAQMHFGLTLDGFVQMTVGSLVETATEYGASGLAGAIGPELTDPIKEGLLGLAETLDNRLETLPGAALELAVSDTITVPLAQQLQGWDGVASLDPIFQPYFGAPGGGGLLQDALETFEQFDAGVGQIAGVTEELRTRLAKLQRALDCAVALLGGQLGEHQNAALTAIFEYFIQELELNPDVGIGEITGSAEYGDALGSLTDSANLGWLADAREALAQLSETVGTVHDFLAQGEEFFEEIQNVFANAAQVINAVKMARDQILERVSACAVKR